MPTPHLSSPHRLHFLPPQSKNVVCSRQVYSRSDAIAPSVCKSQPSLRTQGCISDECTTEMKTPEPTHLGSSLPFPTHSLPMPASTLNSQPSRKPSSLWQTLISWHDATIHKCRAGVFSPRCFHSHTTQGCKGLPDVVGPSCQVLQHPADQSQ